MYIARQHAADGKSILSCARYRAHVVMPLDLFGHFVNH
jgi:hypothetical protein